jgi:hypothetical protein
MSDSNKAYLERALALAHAALEEPTSERVRQARLHASEIFWRMHRIEREAMTMSEARLLVELMVELRAVIGTLARENRNAAL